MADYRAIGDGVLSKVFLYEAATDWTLANDKKDKGVRVFYRQGSDFDGRMYKSEYEVNTSPEKVMQLSLDNDKRVKWDTSVKEVKSIQILDEDTEILYTILQSYLGGLVSSRDMIDIVGVKRYPEKNLILLYWTSVEHPDYPKVKKYVRGLNYPSATFLYSIEGDPNRTRVVDILQSDLSLSPKSLIEKMLPILMPGYADDLRKGTEQFYK
ncbi:stAR-related lipid transfer protein 6-like [Glandiceps talaboti]